MTFKEFTEGVKWWWSRNVVWFNDDRTRAYFVFVLGVILGGLAD